MRKQSGDIYNIAEIKSLNSHISDSKKEDNTSPKINSNYLEHQGVNDAKELLLLEEDQQEATHQFEQEP